MKRNDVVMPKTGGGFYGRIVRRIDSDHVQVICCGKHITVYHEDELEVHNDYKGFTDRKGHFIPMTSLRRLKQMASYYHDVWKKSKTTRMDSGYNGRVAERITAPFTDKQVIRINEYQKDGQWAPYTCVNRWDHESSELDKKHQEYEETSGGYRGGAMIAHTHGLQCPVCGDIQPWVDPYALIGKNTSKAW